MADEKKKPALNLSDAKIVEDKDDTFTVERGDGKRVEVAKTADTHPIYKLLSNNGSSDNSTAKAEEAPEKAPEKKEEEKPEENTLTPAKDIAIAKRVDTPSPAPTPDATQLPAAAGELAAYAARSPQTPVPNGGSPLASYIQGRTDVHGNPAQGTLDPQIQYQESLKNPQSPQQAQAAASVAQPIPDPTQQTVAPDQSGTPTPPAPMQSDTAPSNMQQQITGKDEATRMSPGTQAAFNQQNTDIGELQKNLTTQYSEEAKNKATQATAEGNLARYYDDKLSALNNERDKNVRLKLAEIDQVAHKFAGMSVDSGRFFGNASTGRKVLAGIGLALGALGQGLNGQKNAAIDILDKAIDRDIEEQKANINKTGKEYEMLRGGLKDYLSVTHDMETAVLAEKARGLDGIIKGFEAISAANSNAAVKARAAEVVLPLKQKQLSLIAQVEKNVHSVQTMQMPIKLGEQNQNDVEKVRGNLEGKHLLLRLKSLQEANKELNGPVAGRWQDLKAKLGLNSGTEQQFRSDLKLLYAETAEALAKSRAFAPAEFGNFKDLVVRGDMNNEAFGAQLKSMLEKFDSENNAIVESNRQNQRRPIDLGSLENSMMTPEQRRASEAKKVGYKESPGAKKKK